jgi:hypothetical protein
MSERKIMRNILKRKLGHNRIQEAWHEYQLKRYGFKHLEFGLHKELRYR